jgi:hypothetical protein
MEYRFSSSKSDHGIAGFTLSASQLAGPTDMLDASFFKQLRIGWAVFGFYFCALALLFGTPTAEMDAM